MFERSRCPVCDATPVSAGEKRGFLRTRSYQLVACNGCGLAWVVDADTDFDALYDDAYYRGKGADPLVNYVAELDDPRTVRRYEWDGLLRIARGLGIPAKARWIDFGGGAGGFTRYLATQGYDAHAYDTGAGVELGRRFGVPTIDEADLDSIDGTVDVVSAIEVAEHLLEPDIVFARIARLLRPGGLVLLTTGNLERAPADLTTWGYVMPEVHVTFYTPRSLAAMYRRCGLEPIDASTAPGWDQVVRYKVLKTLGIHRIGGPQSLIPWRFVSPLVDRLRGVSAMPFARKPHQIERSRHREPQ